MTGKKVLTLLLVTALISAVLVSCQDSAEPAGTKLNIRITEPESVSRTIMPASALMEVHKYSVSGLGPGGKTFGPVLSTESSVTVESLDVGNWTISAKALNAENNELSSGSGTVFIGRGQNDMTVTLDTITGSGNLQLNLTWDDDITYLDSLRMDVSLLDTAGTVISTVTRESALNNADGISVLIPLAAGCHVLSVRVYDDDGSLDVGATDAVRIISGTTSVGTMHLKASNPSPAGELSIGFSNNVGVPMSFYIDYSPKVISVGQSVTLVAQHGTLPSNITSFTYQWFVDGVLFSSGTSQNCTIQAAYGLHRYDVIVRSNIEGTMCGASMMLNVT